EDRNGKPAPPPECKGSGTSHVRCSLRAGMRPQSDDSATEAPILDPEDFTRPARRLQIVHATPLARPAEGGYGQAYAPATGSAPAATTPGSTTRADRPPGRARGRARAAPDRRRRARSRGPLEAGPSAGASCRSACPASGARGAAADSSPGTARPP